jgi:hypothetical protein
MHMERGVRGKAKAIKHDLMQMPTHVSNGYCFVFWHSLRVAYSQTLYTRLSRPAMAFCETA